MNILEIIYKKRFKKTLSPGEISFFVKNYAGGLIPDYQASALLMAIAVNGMTEDETVSLTESMAMEGKTLDYGGKGAIDKHSTGGVGDKVSLILVPLAASFGLKIPMISGRGLSFTGGTIDKLEGIPGFRTEYSAGELKMLLKKAGCFICGQSAELAPADRLIYDLRNSTSTVDVEPLGISSILSKKLAAGVRTLVMDIKVPDRAALPAKRKLAAAMKRVAARTGIKMTAYLTRMDDVLGYSAGNSLEVLETIEVLRGASPNTALDLALLFAERMLKEAGINKSRAAITENIKNGAALSKFRQMINAQGGDPKVIDDPSRLGISSDVLTVKSPSGGYLDIRDIKDLGLFNLMLGTGRKTLSDRVDPGTGFVMRKKKGECFRKGEPVADIFYRRKKHSPEALKKQFLAMLEFQARPLRITEPPVYGIV